MLYPRVTPTAAHHRGRLTRYPPCKIRELAPQHAGLLLAAGGPAEILDRFEAWRPPAFPRAWLSPLEA